MSLVFFKCHFTFKCQNILRISECANTFIQVTATNMTSITYLEDVVAVTETIGEWRKRKGVVQTGYNGRPTTFSMVEGPEEQVKQGYVSKLGHRPAKNGATPQQILLAFKHAQDNEIITEVYPRRFCVHCKSPSWNFAVRTEAGHSTCKKCGTVNRNPAVYENLGTLHLNDSGKANKGMWNITPGMTHHDTMAYKNGKPVPAFRQRTKAHRRNFRRIQEKIEDIAQEWHFGAMENIIKSAKSKLRAYYNIVHSQTDKTKEVRKMPHGAAALAAACIYAAVLEFEQKRECKTVCTLPAIQESAQSVRDHKHGRMTRDVTDHKIIRYTKLLKNHGICTARIPHISAETLRFHPRSSAMEHARMAMFNRCAPARFHLPAKGPWGITIEDSKQGVLYIASVKTDGKAFAAGIRKGDCIFQVNRQVAHSKLKPATFPRWVQELKSKNNKPTVELTIMRKKKNSV